MMKRNKLLVVKEENAKEPLKPTPYALKLDCAKEKTQDPFELMIAENGSEKTKISSVLDLGEKKEIIGSTFVKLVEVFKTESGYNNVVPNGNDLEKEFSDQETETLSNVNLSPKKKAVSK